ncbi:hypothetical protein Q1695_014822 [Nippostrongylus brasiliensis]|nr:hypothetical protein Q1695_014822 [Nippostrongylus brasiliensis]
MMNLSPEFVERERSERPLLRPKKVETQFPEFLLEKEFQCHNTLLVKDVVCKTIQKFVKRPQDVRLAITVSFQPRITAKVISHEHEAIATIEVDKPGDFYPGGQEQRVRDKELEVLRKIEEDRRKGRQQARRKFHDAPDNARPKTDVGIKRPPSSNGGDKRTLTRPAPPPPLQAERRQLPTGEMYAVRELVRSSKSEKMPDSSILSSPSAGSPIDTAAYDRKMAIREVGRKMDDCTDRDGSSMEAVDIVSEMETYSFPEKEEKKTSTFLAMPSDAQIKKEIKKTQGVVELDDNGKSSKVIAYIAVQ